VSDPKDHPKGEEELDSLGQTEEKSEPGADERTMFDTEMLDRLNALHDDDDEDEFDEHDEDTGAEPEDDTGPGDALPSQISSLQDVGDLVEPVTGDVVHDGTQPSSSLEKLMNEEVGEETKDVPLDMELSNLADSSSNNVTRPGFQSEPKAVLDEELTPPEGAPVVGTADHIDKSNRPSASTPTGAELWDEVSEPGDRSLSPTPAAPQDHSVEATAALLIENMPETGDVEMALGDQNSGEDRTDRETAPEIVRLECTGEHPALEVADRALVLGRSSSCDVPIADPTMSRRHVNIWLREGRVWVEDLGSGNGTWINDFRIAEPTALEAGDHLRLGQSVVFLMPDAVVDEIADEPKTQLAEAIDEPLLGPSGGHSTTYAHGHPGRLASRLRVFAPLIAASLLFVVGASVFFVRQSRAQARQTQLNSATTEFFKGIEHMSAGAFKEAGASFDQVSKLDPRHPRLPLYRKTVQRLVRQSEQLDRAEAALKDGQLQEAASALLTMDVAPQLEERLKKLNQQIDGDRMSGRVKAFEERIAKGDKAGAEELLKELKAAGLKRSTLDRLEGLIDRKGSAKSDSKSSGNKARSRTDNGPLRRVHLALRQGRVEEAFRINRDLAASGVKQAEKLENTGNLGELRDVIRMAESAAGRQDWGQIIKSTDHGLKLTRRISPRASGTLSLLNRLRANGFYFRASEAASKSDFCGARRYLLKVKRLNSRHPKVKNGLAKTEAFAAAQVDRAKAELAKGFSVDDVREILKTALCTSSRSAAAHREAKRLLNRR